METVSYCSLCPKFERSDIAKGIAPKVSFYHLDSAAHNDSRTEGPWCPILSPLFVRDYRIVSSRVLRCTYEVEVLCYGSLEVDFTRLEDMEHRNSTT